MSWSRSSSSRSAKNRSRNWGRNLGRVMMRMLKAAIVACLAGFVVPAHAQGSWDGVVDAAKKEGKVVVYDMALGAPYFLAVLKSFEAKYGIPVESLDLRASELAERIRTEQSTGR